MVDSRGNDTRKYIRRRRKCSGCGERFTTHEKIAAECLLDQETQDLMAQLASLDAEERSAAWSIIGLIRKLRKSP